MTETTHEQAEGLGPPMAAASNARPWDLTAPWHPPMSLWRFSVLILLSLGCCLPLWILRLTEDLQAHRERGINPLWPSAGILLPLAGWLVWHSAVRRVAALGAEAGRGTVPQVWATSLFGIAVLALYHAALIGLFLPHDLIVGMAGLALFVAVALLPFPCLLLQRRINAYKMTLANPRWTSQPFKFAPGEISFLALVLALLGYVTYANTDFMSRTLARMEGQTLAAGQVVSGENGLYQLTLPNDGWVQVGTDEFYEGSDLSLYGPAEGTRLFVYIDCDGETIDQRVSFRRGRMRSSMGDLAIEERRVLLAESLVPVSYARYTGTRKGAQQTFWVATVAEEDFLVEVLGRIRGGEADQAAAEAFVRSLRLEEGVTSCKKS